MDTRGCGRPSGVGVTASRGRWRGGTGHCQREKGSSGWSSGEVLQGGSTPGAMWAGVCVSVRSHADSCTAMP